LDSFHTSDNIEESITLVTAAASNFTGMFEFRIAECKGTTVPSFYPSAKAKMSVRCWLCAGRVLALAQILGSRELLPFILDLFQIMQISNIRSTFNNSKYFWKGIVGGFSSSQELYLIHYLATEEFYSCKTPPRKGRY
jgi:hypothetical protein